MNDFAGEIMIKTFCQTHTQFELHLDEVLVLLYYRNLTKKIAASQRLHLCNKILDNECPTKPFAKQFWLFGRSVNLFSYTIKTYHKKW